VAPTGGTSNREEVEEEGGGSRLRREYRRSQTSR
jgi:hypothetical protein